MPLLAARSLYEAGAVVVNLVGVSASASVGSGNIKYTFVIGGVAASPAIGTGTVITAAAGTVTVLLVGVAANPRIGAGTVQIQEVVIWGATAPLMPRRRKPKQKLDAFIYVYGVEARPRIGRFLTPAEVRLLASVVTSPAVGELTTNTSAPVDGITANAAIGSLIVVTDAPMIGVQAVAEVGTGAVKTIVDLFPEEILALLEAA